MDMNDCIHIIALRDMPSMASCAATWFHERWHIPYEAYLESIQESLRKETAIPQWYLVLDKQQSILAGAGLIANDFHKRSDLTPNVCALYVEPSWRHHGIARYLLDFIQTDAAKLHIFQLYLLTNHTSFYEACGWEFLCMTEEDSGDFSRVYTKKVPFFPSDSNNIHS